jgi:hypothetical protein
MSRVAIVMLAAACNGAPVRPDLEQFRHMNASERCDSTLQKVLQCADPAADRKQIEATHRQRCQSEFYPEAVHGCWKQTDCDAFAACVAKRAP